MEPMTKEERDVQRKLKALRHTEKIGDAGKACRYFGIGRSSFYRWKASFVQNGEAGLITKSSFPKTLPTRRRPRSSTRSYTHEANTI
jgi:hypothetical protein